ncbi:MAG TPA: M14 family zinc carboxypeptidase [Ramlibacter sp.]|uniref:M14 family zinc carboxypeptidase n=1 Tax=Ramlibacter sp. TaxID=1917967 RepID=UPI002D552B13|nr:M14 family zinc carboxypeptidase [Ramlibacter sp.]HZY18213.1 M14 family zinc carboxypeptidase [Ramlibacter sp.]
MTAPSPVLPELADLERAIEAGGAHLQVTRSPAAGPRALPVYSIALGNPSPDVPAVGFFGGVHGLERIGAQVVIAWLHSLVARLPWDTTLRFQLEQVRLVFMPLVNPGGMLRGTRANPAGVDLMRNAPVEAVDQVPMLVGGQRLSAGLPWFRGRRGAPMEPESAALCEVAGRELLGRPLALVLDCHSGFGLRDRLWFPYAHTRRPIAHLAELHALAGILGESHPHHPYVIEPQSRQYLTHGDLWDHLYLRSLDRAAGILLPLTLEMGSWLWVKKNPRQIFSRDGIFNPQLAHRQERVLRRHLPLLDFLVRAAIGHGCWMPAGAARDRHRRAGIERWYRAAP